MRCRRCNAFSLVGFEGVIPGVEEGTEEVYYKLQPALNDVKLIQAVSNHYRFYSCSFNDQSIIVSWWIFALV